jgi:hypothetical protein
MLKSMDFAAFVRQLPCSAHLALALSTLMDAQKNVPLVDASLAQFLSK